MNGAVATKMREELPPPCPGLHLQHMCRPNKDDAIAVKRPGTLSSTPSFVNTRTGLSALVT